jgi:CubicO group peptidase (beta-lactamase class C family)
LNATVALDAIRAGKLKLEDQLASGATVREFLAHQKEVPNGNKQLVDLIAKNGGGSLSQIANRRIMTPVGMHKTVADSMTGMWKSNVDELYRWELGLNATKAMTEEGAVNLFTSGLGWHVDTYKGHPRQSEYGAAGGKRNAYVRFPDRRAAIIILTNSDTTDARALADKIADRLLSK